MKTTKEKVSILGFGCMRLPTLPGDKIDEEQSSTMFHYAIEHGINYFDTAYYYHKQQSEKILGKFLFQERYRDRIFLATKLPSPLIKSHHDLKYYLDLQLERLKTDYIDFYLLHTLNKRYWHNLLQHEVFQFLENAKTAGKIRYYGFSFHDDLYTFKEIIDYHDWDFCQIQYNFLDENFQAGKNGLEYADKKGIDVIVMEPIKGGSIANNIPDAAKKVLQNATIKRSPAAWALRWVWNHPQVTMVLSGMSSLQQVKENILTAQEGKPNSLTSYENHLIRILQNIYKNKKAINCTGCKYCMPCPNGVNIPMCLKIYNDFLTESNLLKVKQSYQQLVSKKEYASLCQNCSQCEEKCPQQLPIRQLLQEVSKLLE